MNDRVIDIHTFASMQEWLERVVNMSTDASLELSKDYPNFMLRSANISTSTMSYSDWAFGFSISGAVVTVNGGKVRHGTRTPIAVAGVAITVTVDQTWIYVEYGYGDNAGGIESSTTEPVDTETIHYHVLFLVSLTAGTASVATGNIKSLGDIFIPGAFA
jgi:hypothetical protein